MKAYWDSSALVEAYNNPRIKARLENERAFTRPHTLAETFSTLTGNPANRLDADAAAGVLARLALSLDFVEISGAKNILTLDKNDFADLTRLEIEQA
jgi:hypothetical protein